MDVSTIAAIATNLSQSKTADQAQIGVFKKALDIQAAGAAQLIQAAAQVIPTNPAHLGQNIDTYA